MKKIIVAWIGLLSVVCFLTGCVYVKNDFIDERPPELLSRQNLNITKITFVGTKNFPESRISELDSKLLALKKNLEKRFPSRFNVTEGSRSVELRLSAEQGGLSSGERINLGASICTLFIIPFWETDHIVWSIEFLEDNKVIAAGSLIHTLSYFMGIPPFIVFGMFMDDYHFYDFREVLESTSMDQSIYNTSLMIPQKESSGKGDVSVPTPALTVKP